jgi:hypothetical protein
VTYHTKLYLHCPFLGSLLCLASSLYAADLKLLPDNPIVETGKSLTLAVSGTDRKIATWKAAKGKIPFRLTLTPTYNGA